MKSKFFAADFALAYPPGQADFRESVLKNPRAFAKFAAEVLDFPVKR